jgi:hypothetical protein
MARPKGDLGDLAVSKDADPAPAAASVPGSPVRAYAHTLSFRLTREQYRRLRRFVADQEAKSDQRVTHQAVIEIALDEYMSKHGG